ncbi:hypothetical protein PILCRDRAFT_824419 [Piloderma croceum F 1598]|uniref:Uncharacterized protein n=1 Tax=Piloderma croceum (strain F 1598) TaxID=765440 RepID=A0A0C3FET2_PILCF|nr:hypothetical protein PILCRDRAFT_824419 [Piloderma croceum F 1598]
MNVRHIVYFGVESPQIGRDGMHDLAEEHCDDELAGLAWSPTLPTTHEHISNPTITTQLIENAAQHPNPPAPHPIFQPAIQPKRRPLRPKSCMCLRNIV